MASDSILELSIAECDSGPSLSSQFTSKAQSNVLEFCRTAPAGQERDENGRKLYWCGQSECNYSTCATTNLRLHLKRKHSIVILPAGGKGYRTREAETDLQELVSQIQGTDLGDKVLRETLDQKLIQHTLLEFIIVQNLSFRIVESREFHNLCLALNRQALDSLPVSHNTLTQKVKEKFLSDKDFVRKKLQSAATKVHLTVDIWTSPSTHLYLAVCAHFHDTYDTPWCILLALPEVLGHSGEHQWEVLLPVLQDYGIVRNIGAITGDNSGTNDTLCRTISTWLSEHERIDWRASVWRIRCAGHFINLFVQAFMIADKAELSIIQSYEEVETQGFEDTSERIRKDLEAKFREFGVLGKLHNIVVHIRSSPHRTKQFEDRAKRRIPLDNRTRWNSWWAMLDVALTLQEPVMGYLSANLSTIDKADHLSLQDWALLRTIYEFLDAFKSAIKILERTAATLDQVLTTMDVLKDIYSHTLAQLPNTKPNQNLRSRIIRSQAKFNIYYDRLFETPLYALAVILNPNYRTWYGEKLWEKTRFEEACWQAKRFWEGWRREAPLIRSYDTSPQHSIQKPPKSLDTFDRFRAQIQERYRRPQSQDEFDNYLAEVSYGLEVEDPIRWWLDKEQTKRWPQLSVFAVNILSIPPMSAKPEVIFSGARRTIRWDRTQLGVETVEVIECEKDWIRSRILKSEL